MNYPTSTRHRFAIPGQQPSKPCPPPVPRTPLSKPASYRPPKRDTDAKRLRNSAPAGLRFASPAAYSLKNLDTIQDDSDPDEAEWQSPRWRNDPESATRTDRIDVNDFRSKEYVRNRKRYFDSDDMLLDSAAHDRGTPFMNQPGIIHAGSTLPQNNPAFATPSKRRRLIPPPPTHTLQSPSPSAHALPILPSSPLPSTTANAAVHSLATATTPRPPKPRFSLHPPEHLRTPSDAARSWTTPGPKAFILPLAEAPQLAPPDTELFSPRRRGARFVEGGMAAAVAGWIVEGWEKEQIAAERQTQAAWRGWKPTSTVDKPGARQKGLSVCVEDIRKGSEKPGLGGLTLMRAMVGEEVRCVAVVPRLGTGNGARQASKGDVVSLEARRRDIQVHGVRWLIATEGRVVSDTPG